MSNLRTLILSLTLAGIGLAQDDSGRVIVLGMDGMDAARALDMMDTGDLPNFSRLREMGSFAPLNPANPAQSPVSWATLNTGRNPGKHGIFDFVRVRRPGGKPTPDVGFQEMIRVPFDRSSDPLAATWIPWALFGFSGVLVLLAVVLRRRIAVVVLCLFGGAVNLWVGVGLQGAFPQQVPSWNSLMHADEWWVDLDKAGIPFRGQGVIVSYPVDTLEHGQILAGLGAPDAKGGLNSWSIYTTAAKRTGVRERIVEPAWTLDDIPNPGSPVGTRAGSGQIFRLLEDGPGLWKSHLYGPFNEVVGAKVREEFQELSKNPSANLERYQELRGLQSNRSLLTTSIPMSVRWQPGDAAAAIRLDGVEQEVPLGQWSSFWRVSFPWNRWFSTSALIRFWAEERDGELELFMTPPQIDPKNPQAGTKISSPAGFAGDLAERIGDFETLGWACQNMAMKDASLSDAAFLGDIEFTHGWRFRMLQDAFEDDSWKALFHFFGTPDRICHMMMRYADPTHPQYDSDKALAKYSFFGEEITVGDSVNAIYRKMDEVVGWVLDRLNPGDTLLIVSDHGFDSFRREVSLNNWLADEGFLKVKNVSGLGTPLSKREVSSSMLRYVDWSNTQAYSMAIGKIYLNLAGREATGTVSREDAASVLAKITERLLELRDPTTGEKIVSRVSRREEIYDGPWWQERPGRLEGAAELTLDFVPGYRAAWTSTSGGIRLVDQETESGSKQAVPGVAIYDNLKLWSGDHCGVEAAAVQGIFFSNRQMKLPAGDSFFDATHLAPTVLDLCGVVAPTDYDRAPLLWD